MRAILVMVAVLSACSASGPEKGVPPRARRARPSLPVPAGARWFCTIGASFDPFPKERIRLVASYDAGLLLGIETEHGRLSLRPSSRQVRLLMDRTRRGLHPLLLDDPDFRTVASLLDPRPASTLCVDLVRHFHSILRAGMAVRRIHGFIQVRAVLQTPSHGDAERTIDRMRQAFLGAVRRFPRCRWDAILPHLLVHSERSDVWLQWAIQESHVMGCPVTGVARWLIRTILYG